MYICAGATPDIFSLSHKRVGEKNWEHAAIAVMPSGFRMQRCELPKPYLGRAGLSPQWELCAEAEFVQPLQCDATREWRRRIPA